MCNFFQETIVEGFIRGFLSCYSIVGFDVHEFCFIKISPSEVTKQVTTKFEMIYVSI